jgi:hypothetical protein
MLGGAARCRMIKSTLANHYLELLFRKGKRGDLRKPAMSRAAVLVDRAAFESFNGIASRSRCACVTVLVGTMLRAVEPSTTAYASTRATINARETTRFPTPLSTS